MSESEARLKSDPRLAMVDHLQVKLEPPVAQVIFNRPEKKNSFISFDTLKPMRYAFEAISEMDDIKIIILRGNGDTFSTGGDVSTIGHMYFDDGKPPAKGQPRVRPSQRRHLRIDEDIARAWEAIAHSPKVVIAEGKGYVLGLALDWFLAADIIICADDTTLGYPPGRMIGYAGVNPMYWLLRMGPSLHAEITLMGRYIKAQEGYDRGLINKVVPRADLEATVEAAARSVACIPADGLAIGKLSKRIAYEALGVRASGLQSVMGHSMGVQQTLDEGEWSLMRQRSDHGAKAAWQDRDRRFRAALDEYNRYGSTNS